MKVLLLILEAEAATVCDLVTLLVDNGVSIDEAFYMHPLGQKWIVEDRRERKGVGLYLVL